MGSFDIRNIVAENVDGFPDTRKVRGRDQYRTRHDKPGEGSLRPFVSWDGEAAGDGSVAQNYCLIGNSAGAMLSNANGRLSSEEIMLFLLDEAERLHGSIHVAFGFGYDINHIIRDLPHKTILRLHKENEARWKSFRIEWYPKKWLTISQPKNKRLIRIYDTISFWQGSLVKAIETDPQLRDHPELERIKAGKLDRGTFTHDELETKVIPYFQSEMKLHVMLMENLRQTLVEVSATVGGKETNFVPNEWYGSSAIIKTLYGKANLKSVMNRPVSDLTRARRIKRGRMIKPDMKYSYTMPSEVNTAARAAFAGGRFEQFKIGIHYGKVYSYDITSAYPAAQRELPQLVHGEWVHLEGKKAVDKWRKTNRIPEFGFYRIYFDVNMMIANKELKVIDPQIQIHPLFRRDELSHIWYPPFTFGWYPQYSASTIWNSCIPIIEAWIWKPAYELYPFNSDEYINFDALYELRNKYKAAGREDLSYAVKITLNSGYGKTAQKTGVGLGDNLPAFHQIEWASHITDNARELIFQAAVRSAAKKSLIAIETDAIYCTEPNPFCEERLKDGLGNFKREEYDGICYLQNGVYFTLKGEEWTFHYRGMAKDSLDMETVKWHLGTLPFRDLKWPSLSGYTKTFVGIGLAGISTVKNMGEFYGKWLKWKAQNREIRLGSIIGNAKRFHHPRYCMACIEGIPPSNELHDLIIPRNASGSSVSKKYLWIPENVPAKVEINEGIWS